MKTENKMETPTLPKKTTYQDYITDVCLSYDIPKTKFRDMGNIMSGICHLSHTLSNEAMIDVLKEEGWKQEQLEFHIQRDTIKYVFQSVVFASVCEENGIPESYCFSYLNYWDDL